MALFTAKTYLIQYHPYQYRNECCAVGMLVIKPDNTTAVYIAKSLKKAKALNPSCSVQSLREGLEAVALEIAQKPNMLELYQSGFGLLKISPNSGYIAYSCDEEYGKGIAWALSAGIEPAAPINHRERASVSKLFVEIKSFFNTYSWIAKTGQGLSDHVIVPRYPIAIDEGLSVDFALKNGYMHLIQTVDFRTAPTVRRTEAQSKLVSFAVAPSLFDHPKQSLIIAGASDSEATKTIRLAERLTDDIYIKESSEDMKRLFNTLSTAMGQTPMPVLSF
jgi:hypothetical protein